MAITFHPDGRVTGGTIKSTGNVIQVVNATTQTRTTVSSNTNTYYATNLTANITPSATTSKILVLAHSVFSESYDYGIWFRVMRDSTPLTGATTGNRTPISFGNTTAGNYLDDKCVSSSFSYVDEPTSISQLTYKIQAISRYSPQTWSYNKSYDTGDSFANGQGVSTLTLLEVKG